MVRKPTQIGCTVITVFLTSIAAYAQTGMLHGRVVIKQDDGMKVVVDAATVDVFRVDLPGQYTTKTDRSGEFFFAGLPYVGTYLLAASASNAKPNVVANVKAGRDHEYEIVLEAGYGQRLTMDEAQGLAATTRGNVVPRAETPHEILSRSFREGNMALVRKDYDEAIRLFDEGLTAVPHEPALLINKSVALRTRGIESYNTAIASSRDDDAKRERMASAHRDFREAAGVITRAVEIMNNQTIPADESEQRRQLVTKYAALSARAEAMRLFVSIVDPTQAAAGLAAFQDYVNAEDDPYKRASAELDAARMLLDSKNANLAIEQYRRILVRDPNEMEALAGLGLALYQSGDKSRFLEASGYLQRFMDQGPEAHPMRPAVAEVLKKLRSTQ